LFFPHIPFGLEPVRRLGKSPPYFFKLLEHSPPPLVPSSSSPPPFIQANCGVVPHLFVFQAPTCPPHIFWSQSHSGKHRFVPPKRPLKPALFFPSLPSVPFKFSSGSSEIAPNRITRGKSPLRWVLLLTMDFLPQVCVPRVPKKWRTSPPGPFLFFTPSYPLTDITSSPKPRDFISRP